jgi:hypothetical protein
MSKLSIDTDKVKSAGEDIKEIAKEYNIIINELYNKINNISNEEIWISESENGSANKFINEALNDKSSSQALANSMNKLGNRIIEYANNVNITSDNTI